MSEEPVPQAQVSSQSLIAHLRATRGRKWDNYFTGILVLTVVPLLPFIAEVFVKGSIGLDGLLVGAAIYVVVLGFSSEWRTFFVLTIIASFFLSIGYGFASSSRTDLTHYLLAWCSIGLSALGTIIERYDRHVVRGKHFFEWEARQ